MNAYELILHNANYSNTATFTFFDPFTPSEKDIEKRLKMYSRMKAYSELLKGRHIIKLKLNNKIIINGVWYSGLTSYFIQTSV